MTSIFVLPDYQGKGVGRKIVETMEADEYFRRAWRTEVGSSLAAVHF
ncbi:MAG: GNAT family N-acetyltransferase, partial [Fusicatenibacter sp.]